MVVPSLRELRERDERLHEHMILKFGHLSRGRLCARDREIVEARNQALQRHIEEIWAEQEQKNAELRERATDGTRLRGGFPLCERA